MEPPSSDLALKELRGQIARIDRELVRLLGRRLRLAQQAIHLRVRAGGSLTDQRQEREVLARAARWAEEQEVPPKLVADVVRSIVRAGKAGVDNSVVLSPAPLHPAVGGSETGVVPARSPKWMSEP